MSEYKGNRTPAKDHLGNEFNSISEMCRYHNVSFHIFMQRFQNGWGVKEALLTPVKKTKKTCLDHLGNEFNSIMDMCRHYGIPQYIFYNRRKNKDTTLEEILTTKIKSYK